MIHPQSEIHVYHTIKETLLNTLENNETLPTKKYMVKSNPKLKLLVYARTQDRAFPKTDSIGISHIDQSKVRSIPQDRLFYRFLSDCYKQMPTWIRAMEATNNRNKNRRHGRKTGKEPYGHTYLQYESIYVEIIAYILKVIRHALFKDRVPMSVPKIQPTDFFLEKYAAVDLCLDRVFGTPLHHDGIETRRDIFYDYIDQVLNLGKSQPLDVKASTWIAISEYTLRYCEAMLYGHLEFEIDFFESSGWLQILALTEAKVFTTDENFIDGKVYLACAISYRCLEISRKRKVYVRKNEDTIIANNLENYLERAACALANTALSHDHIRLWISLKGINEELMFSR